MSAYRHGGLLARCVGEVTSAQIGRHTLRREVSVIDGEKFYRFTLNPGLSSEFGTFWGDNEDPLLRLVYRKAGIPFA